MTDYVLKNIVNWIDGNSTEVNKCKRCCGA